MVFWQLISVPPKCLYPPIIVRWNRLPDRDVLCPEIWDASYLISIWWLLREETEQRPSSISFRIFVPTCSWWYVGMWGHNDSDPILILRRCPHWWSPGQDHFVIQGHDVNFHFWHTVADSKFFAKEGWNNSSNDDKI